MTDKSTMRLGQISRKLNVGRDTIISFLQKKGFDIDSNPNAKINVELYKLLEDEFENSAVEKKAASDVKIGISEENVFKADKVDSKQNEKEEEENTNDIKIIDKIDLGSNSKKKDNIKKVASSDQSKKKRRPRKRIFSEEKPKSENKKIKKENDDREQKNKEIKEKIKNTLARLSSSGDGDTKRSKYRKEKRSQRAEAKEEEELSKEKQSKTLKVTEYISANDLAKLMEVSVNDVIAKYMEIGIVVSINQRLDEETISLIAEEFGFKIEIVSSESEKFDFEESDKDNDKDLVERAPIVTIMGHVDHGKTSLLDFIRKTNETEKESGGITQHIGAYDVETSTNKRIAFLDTPGHEAFAAMRARGAKLTDIVIIVIAADSAVMPQTKEAINHAKSAEVPIIIAINKIDTQNSNPDKIKEELSKEDILVEDWGGKFQCQEVSAKTGKGINELLEKIVIEAEMQELKTNPKKLASGTIVESSLDKGRGYLTTLMVQGGTLKKGDIILSGPFYGKVKALFDYKNTIKSEVPPSTPILMLGLNGAPQAGEKFIVVKTEKEAREVALKREKLIREQNIKTKKHITLDEIGRRISVGSFKELNIVIKGDVDGSIEALSDSMEKLSNEELSVKIIHRGVGEINESDVLLASAADGIVVGFQVRPSVNARKLAEKEGVEVRLYSIIYEAIEEIKKALEGLLAPTIEENITGSSEVRETYKISKIGTIAGCYVTDGKILRKNEVRLIRDGVVIFTGKIKQLKRFKDDANEVKNGYECGILIEDFNDIKVGDLIECFEMKETKRKI